MKPLISVVIPAYNEEKLIGKCVHSVAHQTFPRENYEILVIDNNSTDRTAEVAREAGATVIPYKEKQGFAVTKQFGTHQAKGAIIAYTDADSTPEKHWLETINFLMENEKLMYIGGSILSNGHNPSINFMFQFYDWLAIINQWFGVSLIWSPNMAVRKDAFLAIGGFNTKIKTSDDWDFTLRLQKQFGTRSSLYTSKLLVTTSPRKQEHVELLVPYIWMGIVNYLALFVFRKSRTFGSPSSVR